MFWRNADAQQQQEHDGSDQQPQPVDQAVDSAQDASRQQNQPTKSSFFFWKSTEPEPPKEQEAQGEADALTEPPKLDRPWYSFFLSDTAPETPEDANATTTKQSLWFWPFSSNAEPESDTEDTDNAEVFRAARAVLDNSRGNAHYAIKYVHGSLEAELAVCGTNTEQAPVPFSNKKGPALPNELLEASLVSSKAKQKALEEQKAQAEQKALEEQKARAELKTQAQQTARAELKTQSPETKAPKATNPPKDVALQSKRDLKGEPKSLEARDAPVKSTLEAAVASPQQSGKHSRTPSVNSTLEKPLVLPNLNNNFREITLVTKARLLGEKFIKGDQTSEKHLYLNNAGSISAKKRKRTKRVVVITMHSLLPPKFVRNYVAQSTGSAKQFGLKAIDAFVHWLDEREDEKFSREISAICLEGQGTITERVRESFRLLRNWRHEINSADMIFFVSSSIATPAAITLFSAMHQSEEFHLHKKKLGMLSMSGIHCGPYPGLNARVVIRAYYPAENEIIKELFELQKTSSDISKQLSADTKYLCENNVKMTLAGSLNDQFVPLFSSIDSLVSHPNIYKCIYIDENCHVPPFLVKLFLVILTMQNVGYLDQNMVTDLSERLQGPVNVNNGSHGRIFDNEDVYETGIRFLMETTTLVHSRALKFERPGVGLKSKVGPALAPKESKDTSSNATTQVSSAAANAANAAMAIATEDVWHSDKNLYHLPWNVRGLVNDLLAIRNIENLQLLNELVEEYKRWQPTKAWRELKLCFVAFEELSLDDLML